MGNKNNNTTTAKDRRPRAMQQLQGNNTVEYDIQDSHYFNPEKYVKEKVCWKITNEPSSWQINHQYLHYT